MYLFAYSTPIVVIDLDGLEEIVFSQLFFYRFSAVFLYLCDMENFDIEMYVKQLKIMYFTLISAPILAIISFYMAFSQEAKSSEDEEIVLILVSIAVIIFLSVLITSILILPKVFNSKLKTTMPLMQKIALYRTFL